MAASGPSGPATTSPGGPPARSGRNGRVHVDWYQRKRTRELALVACFLLPSLLIFLLYRIIPLGWTGVLSFHSWSPLRPARFLGLEHYRELLFHDYVFWQAFTNTLIFIASAPVAIVLALAIALAVNSDLKGAAVYRTIVFLSYPLMTVAVAITWRWLYDERGGFFNYALRLLGIIDKPIDFLGSFAWALPSVILAEIWQVLGFYMIILLTGLQAVPTHLYEAARIDGANARQRFWRITLPMLRPSIFLCAVIGILNSFTAFDLVYVMTRGGPGDATELLITHIYKKGFGETQFDYAAALTMVQFLLLVVLTALANRAAGGNAGSMEKD